MKDGATSLHGLPDLPLIRQIAPDDRGPLRLESCRLASGTNQGSHREPPVAKLPAEVVAQESGRPGNQDRLCDRFANRFSHLLKLTGG